jgi:hypothetical protein
MVSWSPPGKANAEPDPNLRPVLKEKLNVKDNPVHGPLAVWTRPDVSDIVELHDIPRGKGRHLLKLYVNYVLQIWKATNVPVTAVDFSSG